MEFGEGARRMIHEGQVGARLDELNRQDRESLPKSSGAGRGRRQERQEDQEGRTLVCWFLFRARREGAKARDGLETAPLPNPLGCLPAQARMRTNRRRPRSSGHVRMRRSTPEQVGEPILPGDP